MPEPVFPGRKEIAIKALRYFWSYETDLPPGLATPNFSLTHWCWMAAACLLIVLFTLVYRRLRLPARRKLLTATTLLLVCGLIARLAWVSIIGHFSAREMLPLHLCSISVLIEAAAFFSGSSVLKEFSYSCSLPGALAAILTPAWGAYAFVSYPYLQLALEHTLLVLLPVVWIWGDGFRPTVRRLPACFGMLLLLAAVSAVVNWQIGSNYMFLSIAPPGTILAVFESWLGNPGYLVLLVALLLAVWLLLYLPWLVAARFRSKL